MADGYYYLHTNGSLIHKRDSDGQVADFRESDFVRHFWTIVINDRETAWRIIVEALALGANKQRVQDLAKLWQCDDADAVIYAERIGANLFRDGSAWCATAVDFQNAQESPVGFGDTALEALAELAKALGFQACKMWGASLADLLNTRAKAAETAGA